MNFYEIPFFIPLEYIINFLTDNFPLYVEKFFK